MKTLMIVSLDINKLKSLKLSYKMIFFFLWYLVTSNKLIIGVGVMTGGTVGVLRPPFACCGRAGAWSGGRTCRIACRTFRNRRAGRLNASGSAGSVRRIGRNATRSSATHSRMVSRPNASVRAPAKVTIA